MVRVLPAHEEKNVTVAEQIARPRREAQNASSEKGF